MSTVTFRQFSAAEWQGTSPLTIGAVTATAGDTLVAIGISGSGTTDPVTPSTVADGNFAAVTGLTLTNADADGNTFSPGLVLAAAGGSISPKYTQAGGSTFGFFYEYVGVGSVTNAAFINRTTPGTTISGNPVTVPVGALLVAFIANTHGGSAAISASANGGVTPSTRESGTAIAGQNLPWCMCDYLGTGGSITPTFSASDGATMNYDIVQFILNPPAGVATALMGQALL